MVIAISCHFCVIFRFMGIMEQTITISELFRSYEVLDNWSYGKGVIMEVNKVGQTLMFGIRNR